MDIETAQQQYIDTNEDNLKKLETKLIDTTFRENLEEIQQDIEKIIARAEQEVNSKEDTISEVLDEFERDLESKVEQSPPVVPFETEKLTSLTSSFIEGEKQNQLPASEAKVESKIPVSSKTSTPIKVKTIKKHSKVNRDLLAKQTAQTRPAVGDIEWDLVGGSGNEQITEISTLNLEDVSSPNEHQSYEPVVIISPSDDYSGEIDEVILVQTPGDDGDLDEDNDDEHQICSTKRHKKRITEMVTKKTTNGIEEITITTEEHYPNGEIVRREQTEQHHITPQFTISTDDDLQTMSLSINSESDSDSPGGGIESPYPSGGRATNNESVDGTTGTSSSRGGEKTFGSSSESDVALHEAGAELSEDEPGKNLIFCLVANMTN